MKIHALTAALALATGLAACRSNPVPPTPGANGFDSSAPSWRTDSTGGTGPAATWAVRADARAVSAPNVLSMTEPNHASEERFNLYWSDATRFADGRLSVAVRADSGVIDQGGGPVWRVQDANNYYICRYNPLEANFRLYVVKDGVRRQLATSLVEGDPRGWRKLEVEHVGDTITCWIDGRRSLSAVDGTFTKAGGTGVWTKADARTSFDDLWVAPR